MALKAVPNTRTIHMHQETYTLHGTVAADMVNTEVSADRVVDAKEGCGAVGQMADN